jgi:hypothetical protein
MPAVRGNEKLWSMLDGSMGQHAAAALANGGPAKQLRAVLVYTSPVRGGTGAFQPHAPALIRGRRNRYSSSFSSSFSSRRAAGTSSAPSGGVKLNMPASR